MKIVIKKGFWFSNDFLIFMTLVTSMSFRDIGFLSVYGKLIFPLLLLCKYVNSHKVSLPLYKVKMYGFYVAFFILCLCSALWAVKPDYVFSECFVLARLYFTVFAIGCVINTTEDIERCLKQLHYAGIVLFVRLFLNTPLEVWINAITGDYDISSGQGRIGTTVGYYPNELGAICVLLLLLCLYFQSKSNAKKIYWFGWGAILCFVLLFTKSRLALILALAGIILYIIIAQQIVYKRILLFLGAVLLAIVGVYAIFNVPFLYDLVGFRFEVFIGGSEIQDASLNARIKFIIYSVQLFLTSPFIGIGLDNFKYHSYTFQNAWAETYAHSNWGELLADTGIVGILLYYIPYFTSIVILAIKLKRAYGDRRKILTVFLVFLIITVVGDIQKISYDRSEVFIPSILAFFYARLPFNDNMEKEIAFEKV